MGVGGGGGELPKSTELQLQDPSRNPEDRKENLDNKGRKVAHERVLRPVKKKDPLFGCLPMFKGNIDDVDPQGGRE